MLTIAKKKMSNKKQIADCYPIRKINDNTYHIDEMGICNCYLLIGSKKALLIDCGIGLGDMYAFCKTLTPLPIILICTHNHIDHIGGSIGFEQVYLHKADNTPLTNFLTRKLFKKSFFRILQSSLPYKTSIKDLKKGKLAPKVWIDESMQFDLGDRMITIEHHQGHTRGSIIIFDESNKLAFVGDNMGVAPWLYLPNSTSVEEWLTTAEYIKTLANKYQLIWGHLDGVITQEMIDKVIGIAKKLLSSNTKNKKISRIKASHDENSPQYTIVYRTGHILKKR